LPKRSCSPVGRDKVNDPNSLLVRESRSGLPVFGTLPRGTLFGISRFSGRTRSYSPSAEPPSAPAPSSLPMTFDVAPANPPVGFLFSRCRVNHHRSAVVRGLPSRMPRRPEPRRGLPPQNLGGVLRFTELPRSFAFNAAVPRNLRLPLPRKGRCKQFLPVSPR
jgi:hypothetical protein